MNSEITTADALRDIGSAVMQLTYANMMELATCIHDRLLDMGCIDPALCAPHEVAQVLSDTATHMFTQESPA